MRPAPPVEDIRPPELARLERRRRHARLGHTLLWRRCADSTNAWMRREAGRGAREGTATVSDAQSRGRGRRGRRWESPEGLGIYCSVLVAPRLHARRLPMVSLAAGIAAARAVRGVAGLQVSLKWPNDLTLGGQKLGGLLVEGASRGLRQEFVVVGWGLNVGQRRSDFPRPLAPRATSVRLAGGRPGSRSGFLGGFLRELESLLGRLEAGDDAGILDRFTALCPSCRDTRLQILLDGRRRHAVSRGLEADGSLCVELPEGRRCLHGSENLRILG